MSDNNIFNKNFFKSKEEEEEFNLIIERNMVMSCDEFLFAVKTLMSEEFIASYETVGQSVFVKFADGEIFKITAEKLS